MEKISPNIASFDWNHCPEEVMLMIFDHLNLNSLANCVAVNERWRSLINIIAKRKNLWPQLFERVLSENGATYKRKSKLDLYCMCTNYILWQYVNKTKLDIIQTYTFSKPIQNVQVYKDTLIVVTDVAVRRNIENSQIQNDVVSHDSYVDYLESDFIIIIVEEYYSTYKKLYLYGKEDKAEDRCFKQSYALQIVGISLYKLEDEICYVVDCKNTIWVLKWNTRCWTRHAYATFHGHRNSILAFNVFRGKVYILVTNGNIYRCCSDCVMFTQKRSIDMNYDLLVSPIMFQKHSVVLPVPSCNDFKVIRHAKGEQFVLVCPGVTCATQHGYILFLGYETGEVDVCNIKELQRGTKVTELQIKLPQPDKIGSSSEFSKAVRAINVYEGDGCHHIFIGTMHHVYHVVLRYPYSSYSE